MKFKWYNPEINHEVESDSNVVRVAYDEVNDYSVLFLGDTGTSIVSLSGDISDAVAKKISKELGWKVKQVV